MPRAPGEASCPICGLDYSSEEARRCPDGHYPAGETTPVTVTDETIDSFYDDWLDD